jgi:hypothetical protein
LSLRNFKVQHGPFCLIHRASNESMHLHVTWMTNVKNVQVKSAVTVILSQGPCMDRSGPPNVSDSSLHMWSKACVCIHFPPRQLRNASTAEIP